MKPFFKSLEVLGLVVAGTIFLWLLMSAGCTIKYVQSAARMDTLFMRKVYQETSRPGASQCVRQLAAKR